MSQWLMAMPVAVRTGRHCVMSVVVMSVVVAKDRQFNCASLIVVASVARVNRRLAVARGCCARWSWHFRVGVAASVAVGGRVGGGRHEPVPRRAQAGLHRAQEEAQRRTREIGIALQEVTQALGHGKRPLPHRQSRHWASQVSRCSWTQR
jgi:hypothetical protein